MATPADAQAAMNAAAGVAGHTWPQTSVRLGHLLADCGLRGPADVATFASVFEFLDSVAVTLQVFDPAIYQAPLDDLAAALAPAASAGSRLVASVGNAAYRSARKQASSLLRPGVSLSPARLLDALSAAAEQRRRWANVAVDGGAPPALRDTSATGH